MMLPPLPSEGPLKCDCGKEFFQDPDASLYGLCIACGARVCPVKGLPKLPKYADRQRRLAGIGALIVMAHKSAAQELT